MGSVWSCIFHPDMLSIGSSGSLSGIFGAWPVFIAITWNQTTHFDRRYRDRLMIVVMIGMVVLIAFSFMPMVDWSAHLGGLVTGAALAAAGFAHKLQTRSWSV